MLFSVDASAFHGIVLRSEPWGSLKSARPTKSRHANILTRESAIFVLPVNGREIRTANQNIGVAEKIWPPSKREPMLLVNASFLVRQHPATIQTAPIYSGVVTLLRDNPTSLEHPHEQILHIYTFRQEQN